MLNQSCILRINLIWLWYIVLSIYCWSQLTNIWLKIFLSHIQYMKESDLLFSFFVPFFGIPFSVLCLKDYLFTAAICLFPYWSYNNHSRALHYPPYCHRGLSCPSDSNQSLIQHKAALSLCRGFQKEATLNIKLLSGSVSICQTLFARQRSGIVLSLKCKS